MGLKEKFRDKSIDKLAWTLTNLTGVKAQISERKRPEEKVENSWYLRSLGVIDITDGPIKWISILKKDGSQNNPPKKTKAQIWMLISLKKTLPPMTVLVSMMIKPIQADPHKANQRLRRNPLKGFFDSFKSFSRSLGSRFKVKFLL